MKHLKIFYALLLILFTTAVSGEAPWQDTVSMDKVDMDKELNTAVGLPPFCQGKKWNNATWKKRYGPGLLTINHYCYSKVFIPMCYRYGINQRNACLESQAGQIYYSISHNKDPNFKLLPLLHTEYSIVQSEIGNYDVAIQHLNIAISKNNKYIPAYVKLTDTFIKTQQYDMAETIAKRGLKFKKSKALSRRLEEIQKVKSKTE